MKWSRRLMALLLPGTLLFFWSSQAMADGAENAEVVERVRSDIEYFASDSLEGRGIDTPGIETAAKRILAEYEKLGLKPGMPEGSYRQSFTVAMGDTVVTEGTHVTLKSSEENQLALEIGSQFQPIRRGSEGSATGGLVFVGYGISSEEDQYDDYAGIDVEGRIIVMMRREPRQGRSDGGFKGTETSSHSFIDRKLELAAQHKAAGIIFVNDYFSVSTAEADELTAPSGFGNEGGSVPFVHIKQAVLNQILGTSPLKVEGDKTLSNLEQVTAYVDESLKPVSQELAGWSGDISVGFKVNTVSTDNLIGVVEGEGPLADETIVIGGHYDHIGYGGFGSRAPTRKGEIHNGADDNATGTAAVVELARRIASGPKPKRRMVFICFSAEEKGLLGANHYTRNPAFPLEKTVFMLNFDMIGHLRDKTVEMHGVGTAVEFADLIRKIDEASPLETRIIENPFGGSDHLPFFQKDIPVMFCHTGLTDTYHTPDDDFSTLNIEGAVEVIDYSEQVLRAIDQMEARPTFKTVSRGDRRPSRLPYLGLSPELSGYDGEGVMVRAVREGSPAATAGVMVGDVVLKVSDSKLESYQNLIEILTKSKPGDKLKLLVKRGTDETEIIVELGPPRG
ncbi:MAG: M20/M25/M40 family metallo-hydrolase [Planctomyces sp.]|nr:M20/M25/M40 family metallo-hydrolase [Planctomyces sp.]